MVESPHLFSTIRGLAHQGIGPHENFTTEQSYLRDPKPTCELALVTP